MIDVITHNSLQGAEDSSQGTPEAAVEENGVSVKAVELVGSHEVQCSGPLNGSKVQYSRITGTINKHVS